MTAKPHLEIDAVEPIRAGRQTALPTASEIARARALERVGLDLDWYNTRLEGLRDVNGDPCCESCGLTERKKKSNGETKDLVVDTKSKRLVCASCSNKMYKQSQREKAASRQDREGVPTLEAFWARNRSKLTEAERAQREARHDEAILLLNEVQECIKAFETGAEFDEAALREFIREVCREIIDTGFVLTDITAVDFFKPEYNDFYALWTSDQIAREYAKSQSAYMQFGYLNALPEHVVRPFIAAVEKHLGLPVASCEAFTTRIERIYDALEGKVWKQPDQIIKCETHGCKEVKALPPMSTKWTPQGFTTENIPPAQWFCPTHQAENDKKARTTYSAINKDRLNTRDVTRDKWGREKLYGEGGPYG